MFEVKRTISSLLLVLIFTGAVLAADLEQNWNDYLHYVKIGKLDLATGYAQAIIDSEPDPVKLLELSEKNPKGYDLVARVIETSGDQELVAKSEQVLDIIKEGLFIKRTDPKVIATEIERLSSTDRGRLTALKRLQDAGEYAVPQMLMAIADAEGDELASLLWALPQMGRDAIRPMAAALQTDDVGVRAEIVKALGKIGYRESLGYLKYVVENDESAQVRSLARDSIKEIDPESLDMTAALLFYSLGQNYYYHADSLEPMQQADYANMWFWNSEDGLLYSEKVSIDYFFELMSMRSCEWALRAEGGYGEAISLWTAAFFKAESSGIAMPAYFGDGHPDAMVYATTAGSEYLYHALGRALMDKNDFVALGAAEALAETAGEKSVANQLGAGRALIEALKYEYAPVRYSAAIAIAAAGPTVAFPNSSEVADVLGEALARGAGTGEASELAPEIASSYAQRSVAAMLRLAQTNNTAIDLSAVRDTLINVLKRGSAELRVPAAHVLALLTSPEAQRAIAAIALDGGEEVGFRVEIFNALAESGKKNSNMLEAGEVSALFDIVNSRTVDRELNRAAGAAFGALNLPSEKVKDLILDQAKI